MEENLRLFFSLLWLVSFYFFVVSTILLVVTLGDFLELFAWSLGGIIIASTGAVISSLS